MFSNAWVHQTVEAMCLALMVDPQGDQEIIQAQAKMKATLEDWIPKILAAQHPDAVVLDPRLVAPGDGALVRAMKAQLPGTPFLVVQWDSRVDVVVSRETDAAVDASALPDAIHDALAAHGFGGPAAD